MLLAFWSSSSRFLQRHRIRTPPNTFSPVSRTRQGGPTAWLGVLDFSLWYTGLSDSRRLGISPRKFNTRPTTSPKQVCYQHHISFFPTSDSTFSRKLTFPSALECYRECRLDLSICRHSHVLHGPGESVGKPDRHYVAHDCGRYKTIGILREGATY